MTSPFDEEMDLEQFYNNVTVLSPGYVFEYRSLRLEKIDLGVDVGGVEHDEVGVYDSETGQKLESLTAGAYESFERFKAKLDELAEADSVDSMYE